MQAMPEKFDVDFWKSIISLVSKLAVVAAVFVGGAGGAEQLADRSLRVEELTESEWNARNEYGDALQSYLAAQAACDSALESFARHRDDDEDWQHVLDKCHTDGREE